MPLKLTVFPPDLPGRQVVLSEGCRYLLGRSPEADVVVADGRVSGRHLLIDGRSGSWRISDQASKNGTRIAGRPLDSTTLEGPVWLNIGGVPAFAEPQSRQATRADEQSQERRRAAAATLNQGLHGDLAARILLKRCLDALLQLSGCERACIWMSGAAMSGNTMSGDTGALRPLMLRGAARPRPSRSVIETVAATGKHCIASDTAGAEAELQRGSIERGGIRALVVLPLITRGRCLGVLYADSLSPGKLFTELDIDLLSGLAAQTSVALAVSRLRGELDGLAASAPLHT